MATKREIPGVLVAAKTFIVHAETRMFRFLKGQTTIVAGHPLVSGREGSFRPLTVDFDLPAPAVEPATEPEPEPELTDEQKVAVLLKSNRPDLEGLAKELGIDDPSTFANKPDLAAAIVAAQAAAAAGDDESTSGSAGDDNSSSTTPAADAS